uniref:Tudor domain-containing protein n=1 Tax=Meloidogyne incognita TaxID=6306 RepID=A0A914L4U0_MELIC
MLIRVLSQTPLSSNNKNSFFNRKFIVLFALGGASVTAFWIYRRNIYKFMQNRRKQDKMNRSEQMENNIETKIVSSVENCSSNSTNSNEPTKENFVKIGDDQLESKETAADIKKPDILENEITAAVNNEYSCSTSGGGYANNEEKEKKMVEGSSSSLNCQQYNFEQIIQEHNSQPELDWTVEAEKKINKEEEIQNDLKHLEKIEDQTNNQNTKMIQEQANPKSSYMGRTSTGSVGRQHPVNSICMCSRCVEQLNDLHSSRGYKSSESPHSTHSEGSADSGRATGPLTSYSPFADEYGLQTEILPIYEFEVENTLVGLIIGVKGKTIRELCCRADVRMLIRPHHTQSKYDTHQICSVEGRRENINKCLHMIRLRFPPCRFPGLNLKPVLPPPPTTSATTLRGAPTALTLTEGLLSEVYISANVSAGHFFLQLPTHSSFPSLTVLDQYMLSVYTQPGGAPDLPKPCNVGVLCAAPAYNGWFRAITLAYEPEQDETLVRFVDYGGFARLPRADLRQIRTDFMTLPMQSIECYLGNVQPAEANGQWHEKANELFQQLCVSKVIQAALIGYSRQDGIPFVELYVLDDNKKVF